MQQARVSPTPDDRTRTRACLATVLAAALLFNCPAGQSAEVGALAERIARGHWRLDYQRSGEFKPLLYKHAASGSSETCIDGDPRQHILNWVRDKGCRVDRESLRPDRYQLSGKCRFKWMKRLAVPVEVELVFGDAQSFVMEIRTPPGAALTFHESTRASLTGACPAP
ncbi:MAG: hypothetical protein MUC79_01305 [Thiobacillaceae bacterium]|jgi:hypothetical protein|nr:hypothetical protein [Thiobacillaceae bacterium]